MAERETVHGADPCLVLGEVAGLLVDGRAMPAALATLVDGLGLRTALLQAHNGAVLGGTAADPGVPTVELPVHGRSGAQLATLTVSGAVPAQLPVLRTAAAVLGLALAPSPLADDVEDDRDELADALHDGPVQALVVARYASDAAVRGGDATAARDAVQAALVDVRRFLWHLRPRGTGGVIEALDQLSAHLVEAGGPSLGVIGDVEAAAALRGPAGVTVFRLAQAVARPDAPPVRVRLRSDPTTLVVEMDGGVPLAQPDRWVRRARGLGGELQLSPGVIRLVLPAPARLNEARNRS